ncbi:hypothetical protein AB0O28_22195 [Microbispora sp. NPDC088329]|uniref:hypothetical protein n=1 Tax=Microbispora sp. NPDC088329 TaxID=3154869 RepID=UPI0034459AFA
MKKALTYVLTVLLAGLVLTLGASAASAQGKPIKLEVTGDGADNVNVLVSYKDGNDPVMEIVAATLVATSADGRSFGPVPLRSASEGLNVYRAAEPLPAGEWKVTVTATEPAKATKTVQVKSGAVAVPQAAAAPALNTRAAGAEQDADDSAGMALKIGIIVLAVAAAAAVLIVLARRRNLYARH